MVLNTNINVIAIKTQTFSKSNDIPNFDDIVNQWSSDEKGMMKIWVWAKQSSQLYK